MATYTPVPLPIPELLPDWQLHLKTAGKADSTIISYLQVALAFLGYLEEQGHSLDASDVDLADVEGYLLQVRERTSPANQAKHFRTLQQFWRWLVDVECELDASPMATLKAPRVPPKPVPVIPDDVIEALLAVCETEGKRKRPGAPGPVRPNETQFSARRDAALIRTLMDTGMRVGELVGIELDDLDWRYGVFHVTGKGSKQRACVFGDSTAAALRRYLRVRAHHPYAAKDAFWLGRLGGLTVSGVGQLLERRCAQAYVGRLHPHQFRHTFAHIWQLLGGQDGDLMNLMGWTSRDMVTHYAASAAAIRAQEAHRRLSPGNRL